jgi:tetratricopeptide (TPR) repeat protein
MLQDFAYCYRHAQRWVDLFKQQPEMIEHHTSLYLKGLHNLLNTLFNVLNYRKFRSTLDQLLEFAEQYDLSRNKNVEGLYYLFKYIHSIKRHFMEGTFTEGTRLIPELVEIMEEDRYNWDDHRVMVFYYRIASMYFGSGDFDNAITYLNLIINQKNPDYRGDIQAFARILNLISHFELGNTQLVEYQVKSVYRFLGKMNDLGNVQKEIFRFVRRIPRMQESELKQEFINLRDKLVVLQKDPYEQRPFLYLDIISWLESKIQDRPVEAIIHDQFLKRQDANVQKA